MACPGGRRLSLLGSWALLLSLVGCRTSAAPLVGSVPGAAGSAQRANHTLIVFAAASLREAFGEIGKRFEQAQGVKVQFNFAGSQQLVQQMAGGAPADVFASANQKEMLNAIKAGAVISGTQQVFARNHLVVIVASGNAGKVARLQDLGRPGVRLVLAAEAVPAGQYARQALDKMKEDPAFGPDFPARVEHNVASEEENVRSVVTKVSLGEADAGIVYVSDVTPAVKDKITVITIPGQFNQFAAYPIAATANPPAGTEVARRFVEYVLGAEGQQILAASRFIPAK